MTRPTSIKTSLQEYAEYIADGVASSSETFERIEARARHLRRRRYGGGGFIAAATVLAGVAAASLAGPLMTDPDEVPDAAVATSQVSLPTATPTAAYSISLGGKLEFTPGGCPVVKASDGRVYLLHFLEPVSHTAWRDEKSKVVAIQDSDGSIYAKSGDIVQFGLNGKTKSLGQCSDAPPSAIPAVFLEKDATPEAD